MQIVVRDIPIYYEEAGEGRPLLMLHGSHTDHRQMMHEMEPVFEQRPGAHWRRIYPDLPGRGRTPGADWITREDDVLDVTLEYLDAIAPGERFALVGVSAGGYLARGVVYRRSAQMVGLMLSVPRIERDPAKRELPSPQVLVHNPEFVASLGPDEQSVLQFSTVQSMATLAAYRVAIKPALDVADHEFINRVAATRGFTFDVDVLSEPFAAPTLIVAGRQDSICGYREVWPILENYPRSTFAVLDRSGHSINSEQPALYPALIHEWLDRVEDYAANRPHDGGATPHERQRQRTGTRRQWR
jgi:pimeloyl-ACP methyl ester carboxylesterase